MIMRRAKFSTPARPRADARPVQLLLVGRRGVGRGTLLDALARVYGEIPEHTRLGGTGLRQLGVDVGNIYSTSEAFSALKGDGTVVAW